jgi:hypothetical protein
MCIEKQAVTVAEMAKLVGLSRARFYQLIGTAFPFPVYAVATKRPYYPAELQQVCLEVRQTNCGIDGKPVLFHRRKKEVAPVRPKRSSGKKDDGRYKDLLDGLKSLGLAGTTGAEVQKVLKELGMTDSALKDDGKVLRAVFLQIKRQDISAPAPTKKDDNHEHP